MNYPLQTEYKIKDMTINVVVQIFLH